MKVIASRSIAQKTIVVPQATGTSILHSALCTLHLFSSLMLGHFRRHRLEFLLCLLGVALGVAVVVAIDSAVTACVGSFSGAVQSLAERSTHSIFSAQGMITDRQYVDLAR